VALIRAIREYNKGEGVTEADLSKKYNIPRESLNWAITAYIIGLKDGEDYDFIGALNALKSAVISNCDEEAVKIINRILYGKRHNE
jgi:hypothetical protein